ncbi:DNA repair exonuclease family protein YhaO [hydrothermal vent metagenome]|uniref:DNA repair exonuclease family protein YhaO n=1 Tax=hydrothermal vent metagenome TaxID=652676 RepID=A0A3B1DVG7_9ZZZZ
MFKFIHAADIHLDSPLKRLEQYEGAPVEEIRHATRRAFENLVKTAIDEKIDFVLISGDLYDGDWRDYNTGLFFIKQVTRLREAKIPVYLIAGNHDAANKMTRSLRLPENVTFFSADSPETATIEHLDVAIHGQSFATASVSENLAASYPIAKSGMFNIGLLHTCATGREGHASYAPCSIDDLRLKGYDYWALGHVHTREILSQKPMIAFSGNIQGRHIRETGAKGCLIVSVDENHLVTSEFRALDVLRWERLVLDASDAQNIDEVLNLLPEKIEELLAKNAGLPLAIRVVFNGASPAHHSLLANKQSLINGIRAVAIESGRGDIWVEKVKVQTTPIHKILSEEISLTAIGELATLFSESRNDLTKLTEMKFSLTDVVKKLPNEMKETIPSDDPEWLRSLLTEAESWLISQLLKSENNE